MKKCSNCFIRKPLNEFYKRRETQHQSRCKECNSEVCAGDRGRRELRRAAQKVIDIKAK